jgi:glutaminase
MVHDLTAVLEDIAADVRAGGMTGAVASYIPALARVPPDQFAMCAATLEGDVHVAGDVDVSFSLQSVTKVFTAAMVLAHPAIQDILLWRRVGVEPSGTKFNSLVQLEHEDGIPRNPFINAGALVVADALCSLYDDPKAAVLAFVRELAGDESIDFNLEVAQSERQTGFANRALANFLKANDNLEHAVEDVLDLYFHQCAIAMSTRGLARAFRFLANGGVVPGEGGRRVLSISQTRRLNAVMLTCGFYDQAGEFAYQVGLPGKSGVGGGIACVVPGHMSVAVWSPRLNRYGNSAAGVRALERFTTMTNLSIF